MDDLKQAAKSLAREYAKHGKPDGWFEAFYARAKGDIKNVYWADLEPNPFLLEWVKQHPPATGNRALVIGCGLGDDAEALSMKGYGVTAFDISASAISMCRKRYPASSVHYLVADLFSPPVQWYRSFDLVFECNTVQILTGSNRDKAVVSIADMVAPGGSVLVSCRSRETGGEQDAFPIPLDRFEMNGFVRAGLEEIQFKAYDDDQNPPVPHFFAVYRRSG